MVRSIKGSRRVRKATQLLEGKFGQRKKTKKFDPFDKLMVGILSYRSSLKKAAKAYDNLQKQFVDWNEVRVSALHEIEEAIKDADPQKNKAILLRRVLNDIFAACHGISLDFLREYKPAKAQKFLRSIGGLDEKTINDVLLVCQDGYELPKNEDLVRVAKRLGLIDKFAALDEAHAELQGIVPKNLAYPFTQLMVELGQEVCTERHYAYRRCPLTDVCETYKVRAEKRAKRKRTVRRAKKRKKRPRKKTGKKAK
jgi:endonuclease III